MPRHAVFAYGSLVSPASLAATLGRPAGGPSSSWPATLPGWRRRFSLRRDNRASEKTFALDDGSIPAWILSLNLERDSSAEGPNGALIEVDGDELDRLDRRELRYDRIDVTGEVAAAPSTPRFDLIHAYTAKAGNLAPGRLSDAVVLRSYVHAVESAFDELGPGQLARLRASTEPVPAPVAEARLVRDSIPPGNPRGW